MYRKLAALVQALYAAFQDLVYASVSIVFLSHDDLIRYTLYSFFVRVLLDQAP